MDASTPGPAVHASHARGRFRASAVVVMLRGPVGMREVYWVRRSDFVPFMPGFHAFVGGGVKAGDAELGELLAQAPGPEPVPLDGFDLGSLRTLEACALRETFEETGVLLGLGGADLPSHVREEVRRRVLEGLESFAAPERDWRLHAGSMVYIGRWTTPPFSTARFDSAFFMAELPEREDPLIIPGELASGEWIEPRAALALWKRGEATFAAPVLHVLLELARAEEKGISSFDPTVIERLRSAPRRAGDPVRRIELKWGIVLHPTATRPLPPATHTNTYLVGEREMALIDPGSADPKELESLFQVVAALARDGRHVAAILVTHHHPDHVAGLTAVRERFAAPVLAHADSPVDYDQALADGDVIPLRGGERDWSLRAIHTSGHTRDHLCFYHAATRSLFSGDHIPGGAGTVIIDPPDGDMGDYLQSLERLLAEEIESLFPGHGSPQGAARRRIQGLIAHRREREAKVLAALGPEPRTASELLERVYADTPRELWPYAERSLLAHLLLLERRGQAARSGDDWRQVEA